MSGYRLEDELDEDFFKEAEERGNQRRVERNLRRKAGLKAEPEIEPEAPTAALPKPPKPEKVFPDYPLSPECVHYWHVRPDGSRVCLNCDAVPSATPYNPGYRGVTIYPTSSFALNAIDHPERCREEKDYTEMPDPVRWVSMSDFHRRHRP